MHICMHALCMQVPPKARKGIKTLELEAVVNLGPMEEQQAFLDAEASHIPLLVSHQQWLPL